MIQFSSEFQKFLNLNDFKLIDNLFDGRVNIYKSDYLSLRIVQDNDLTQSIEISSNKNVDSWYDLGRVSTLIYHNDDYLTGLDFEEECKFLNKDINEILRLLGEQHYSFTVQNLKNLGKKRADILF